MLLAVALAAATVAVYAPVVGFDFVDYDDREYVTDNADVRRGLSADTVAWALTARVASHWHPLTMLSHALDWSLFGDWAGGHHATSLALHVANGLLLFGLLLRLTGAPWRSAAVAGLFAMHPLRVESVAWVAERKDVLSAAFYLTTLHAYASWVRRPSAGRYALMAVALAAGLMAKPMVLTLPVVALLLDHWPLRRAVPLGRLVAEKIPLFVLAGASALVTMAAAEHALNPLAHVSIALRVANAIASLGWYLWTTVWPSGLYVLYLHPGAPGAPPLEATTVLAALLLVTAITAWVALERRRRYLVVGWGWYLVTLAPVLGIVQAGLQARADRYTYLALIGPSVMLVWRIGDWLDEHAVAPAVRRAVAAAAVVVLAAYAGAARAQLAAWRDPVRLYRHALAIEPRNFMMHYNLGTQLNRARRWDEALAAFRRSDELNPEYSWAKRAIGEELERRGRLDEALSWYALAVRLRTDEPTHRRVLADALLAKGDPGAAIAEYRRALALDPDEPKAHNNLGNALLAAGDEAAARRAYEHAVRLDPDQAMAHGNLAARLEASGEASAALVHRRAHARLTPDDAGARLALGQALLRAGDLPPALDELRAAHRLAPDDPHARQLLAWTLATRPEASVADGAEAVRLAEPAVGTPEPDAVALATLAVAEAAAGRFADARATLARARAAAAAAGEDDLVAALGPMDERFARGEPYREDP
jgi:tetratricopeptide (TPR) repeat protein